MSISGVSSTACANVPYLAKDRAASSLSLTAFRIAALFSTVISASVFIQTGLIGAAIWCGVSLLCSLVSLSIGARGHRIQRAADPILIVQPPAPRPTYFQTVRPVVTQPPSYSYTAAAAPQPRPGHSGRDAVGSRSNNFTPPPQQFRPAPQPPRGASGRDEVGSRNNHFAAPPPQFRPAAPAPQPRPNAFGRDAVGSRNQQMGNLAPPPAGGGRDVVGGRRR